MPKYPSSITKLGASLAELIIAIRKALRLYDDKKENKIVVSDIEPSNPEERDIWFDDSISPDFPPTTPVYRVTINQSPNQTIKVYCMIHQKTQTLIYTDSFDVVKGTPFEVHIEPNSKKYNTGKLNIEEGMFNEPTTIEATPAEIKRFFVHIEQSPHQTIVATVNGVEHREGWEANFGDVINVTLTVETGYNPGTLNLTHVTVEDGDVYIKATPAEIKTFSVTIAQSPHQTISVDIVDDSGKILETHTTSFVAIYGSKYRVNILAEPGWAYGRLNRSEGVLDSNIGINATPAEHNKFTVDIIQSPHQLIYCSYGGHVYTNQFKINELDTIEVAITADHGYTHGKLNHGIPIGIFRPLKNTEISAQPATPNDYVVKVTQSEHQRIKVSYKGIDHIYNFTGTYDEPYRATIEPDKHYIAGNINYPSGTITDNLEIKASPAILKKYHVTINQSIGQTIHVKIYDTGGNEIGDYVSDFDIDAMSKYKITIEADDPLHKSPGEINIPLSGIIEKDMEIDATPITDKKFTVTINSGLHQRFKVTCTGTTTGEFYDKNIIKVLGGTTVKVEVIPDTGYDAGTPDKNNILITEDTTITIPDAKIKEFEIGFSSSKFHNEIQNIVVYLDNRIIVEKLTDVSYTCKVKYGQVVRIENSIIEDYEGEFEIGKLIVVTPDTGFEVDEGYKEYTITNPVLFKISSPIWIPSVDLPRYIHKIPNYKTISTIPQENIDYINSIKNLNKDLTGCFDDMNKLENIPQFTINTKRVTSIQNMFYRCGYLTELDLSWLNLSKCVKAAAAFYRCNNLQSIDLSHTNMDNIELINVMFSFDINLKSVIFPDMKNAKNIKDISYLFNDCSTLKTIVGIDTLDTSKVENFNCVFSGCEKLTKLPCSNWDTSSATTLFAIARKTSISTINDLYNFKTSTVKNMNSVFFDCPNLTNIDISHWDNTSVKSIQSIVSKCKNLLSVKLFDTHNVTDMMYAFNGNPKLKTINSVIDMAGVRNNPSMYSLAFYNTPNLTGVKIKNPPNDENWWKEAGFVSKDQFTIVT